MFELLLRHEQILRGRQREGASERGREGDRERERERGREGEREREGDIYIYLLYYLSVVTSFQFPTYNYNADIWISPEYNKYNIYILE